MKNFHFLIFLLSLCLLLSSCATVQDLPPDMAITPPDKENPTDDTTNDEQIGEYRNLIHAENIANGEVGAFWNNLVFTSEKMINLDTGEAVSVCSDPLCDHRAESCAKKNFLIARYMLVSLSSTQDDLVLYIFGAKSNVSADKDFTQNYQVLRYHFYTGEVTVLAENLPGDAFSFCIDPVTDNLFFEQRQINDAGETEYFLYVLNGKTGKLVIPPTPNMHLSAKYVVGDMVYCWDYQSAQYCCVDLSQKELMAQAVESREEYGDYRYYQENVVEERVYVPDDLIPLCEKYGAKSYVVYTKYDLYRVNLQQEGAEPELVAEGVLWHSRKGEYLCYYEFAPQYVTSFFWTYYQDEHGARRFLTYTLDDPNVPEGVYLSNEFNEYYATIHVLNTATLQEVATIESEEYWVDPIYDLRLMGDGVFVTWQARDAQAYANKLTGIGSSEKIFGYLYFNKPNLSVEDTVVFDLSDSGF